MKKVAFLTSANYKSVIKNSPNFIDELELLKPVFTEFGAELCSFDWRDTAVDLNSFEVIIPKACWDYSEHPLEFENYLKALILKKRLCQNDAGTVLWNMRKNYLLDLEKKSLSVAKLRLIPQGSKIDLENFTEGFKPSDLMVFKPSISGGARNTKRCKAQDLGHEIALLHEILKDSDLIIQPYFDEIAVQGEYSYLFFNGQFSHAVLKKPASGDFRVQPTYGAKTVGHQASSLEIEEALRYVQATHPLPAYARVDGFQKEGRFQLLELELIEPYLFFEHADSLAAARFARAILGKR